MSLFFLDPKTLEVAPQGFIHQVAALHNKIDIYSYRSFILGFFYEFFFAISCSVASLI